jgi:hypothetical protein
MLSVTFCLRNRYVSFQSSLFLSLLFLCPLWSGIYIVSIFSDFCLRCVPNAFIVSQQKVESVALLKASLCIFVDSFRESV